MVARYELSLDKDLNCNFITYVPMLMERFQFESEYPGLFVKFDSFINIIRHLQQYLKRIIGDYKSKKVS